MLTVCQSEHYKSTFITSLCINENWICMYIYGCIRVEKTDQKKKEYVYEYDSINCISSLMVWIIFLFLTSGCSRWQSDFRMSIYSKEKGHYHFLTTSVCWLIYMINLEKSSYFSYYWKCPRSKEMIYTYKIFFLGERKYSWKEQGKKRSD